MKMRNRSRWCPLALAVVALMLSISAAGAADEGTKEYLTAEEYIELARPYLHMSCEAAWAEAGEVPEDYVGIVDKVSAIAFLNHDLDIEEVYQHPEKDVETLRVTYYNEVGRLCTENPNNLLAGVVEKALLNAFSKVTPEAIED